MIHLLIENNVGPVLRSFAKCLEVAIKCNHNDIANYIFDNLLSDENRLKYTEQSFQDNIYSYCFKYHNFGFDHLDIDNKFIFFFLCQYNYLNLVKLFVKHKKIDINDKVEISKFFSFEYNLTKKLLNFVFNTILK